MCYEFFSLDFANNFFFNLLHLNLYFLINLGIFIAYKSPFFMLITIKTLHTYKIMLHNFHFLRCVLYSQYLMDVFCCHVQIIS